MVHENPWFLITQSELLAIEENLSTLKNEVPERSSQHLGTIARVLSRVRERRP